MKVLGTIYGCLESTMLWYNLHVTTLKVMDFELNPYDLCVANKIINGKQCTIVWYDDDNKISHTDPAVVDSIIQELTKEIGELSITRGKEHKCLVMNIMIRDDNKIEIEMIEQLKEAIEWLGEEIENSTSSPANKKLFTSDDDAKQLNDEKSELFHSIIAKFIFIYQRARPDIEPTVAYLCTRVSKSTIEDWKKLRRLVSFKRGTVNDKRIIDEISLENMHT